MKRGEVAKSLTRGTFFLGIEKTIAISSTIVYTLLLARWLGPTKYGMFTLAFSVVSLVTAFTGNFEMYLERYGAEYQVHGRIRALTRAYFTALGLKLAFGVLATAVLLLITPRLSAFYKIPELEVLLPLLAVFVATDGLATTGRAVLFSLQRFEWVSGLSLIFNLGKTLLVAWLWWSRQGLAALALGFSLLTAVQAVATLSASLWVLRKARARAGAAESAEPGLVGSIFRYCLPLYGARLSFLSGQNLGKLVLGTVLDATQLGYFSFAFQTVERFVELVHTIPAAMLPAFTQIVAKDEREKLRYVVDQAFRLVQLLACMLSFVLFVYAHEIVRLVGSPLFEPAIPLLRVIALVPIARTAQQPLTMLFQAARRPGYVFTLALVKLLSEIAGYFVLLKPFGAMGACAANLAGAAASFTGALILASTLVPEGTFERLGAVVRNILLLAPSLLLTLFAERELGVHGSLPVRLVLVLPSLLGVFALGLLNRYDLEKVSSLPLPGAWLPRVRDALVSVADRLARTFEYRRAA
ncbi:MAG: oligosaccharide flippase family protein [Candidatus Eisenbacteria bacterium]|uniref:Oligosaccharide flippase family protein n=1 Tax=Eiseniibacteriota bacterium TaxID=2212470 RepID=A0A933SGV0_UNCEI|nr:oligosaccharide flippase family protein [Candidatus Eisenbacteria bacterium]